MISIGAATKKPVAVGSEIKIRSVINVTITLDHRYADGAQGADIYKKFTDYLKDPEGASKMCAKSTH